ncbi:phospholipid:diacylglycerol acyltransferase 1-like [Cynara cardunculus var. scolymus]|uniref:phospholipid:diacylglycerol acyltransferase 1-like n=1 Tax=Cynara cardunculus var. scolymus TaxID=59895 RepID=UPI000D629A5B|nr:phospholipid:diacylglycerol acyltransferase 1-like [Cynara cardunculus var. scolymus]
MSLLRRRKRPDDDAPQPPHTAEDDDKKGKSQKKSAKKKRRNSYSCVDNCCWLVGCICTTWWFLLFLYNTMPASFPQYLTEKITGALPDPPGVKCVKEGLEPKHPVVFVPGIVTGGLELWEGHECAEGLFRKRLWGGTFGEIYRRPSCWLQHMSLDNETGLDPAGIRVRPVSGLVAADYFAPGYFVWAVLIANLARVGYEEKNMYMAAYDWRLSFQNTEVRDRTLSRIKRNIELMVEINDGQKAVIIPHSMGVLYFLHFMKWVEAPAPMGGGGGSDWCAKHIKAVMNIGGPLLGAPKALSGLFSAEAKDVAFARGIAPGVLDSDVFHIQTLQHIMRMSRTWDSTMSMIPKGGETIWGGLDWSPEEGYIPSNRTHENVHNSFCSQNESDSKVCQARNPNYGRIISFGRDVAELHSSKLERIDFRGAVKGKNLANSTCRDVWTEYHEMGFSGIKAISEYKAYTAGDLLDMLEFVAPKMMERGNVHFSHGLAENLDDPKYAHYKYWSNALETKLPNAPDMEIYSLYGVGIPTERAYVYKLAPTAECYIPFQIDNTAGDTDEHVCLKDGVYTVDGDETVPALSAGFMCAKGWRGKTRFNPSGIKTYIREYDHNPPSNFLEGRGTQSGAHVDIMGNFQLIEDVIRVAAGGSGEQLGGDRVYTDIFKWSDKINIKL